MIVGVPHVEISGEDAAPPTRTAAQTTTPFAVEGVVGLGPNNPVPPNLLKVHHEPLATTVRDVWRAVYVTSRPLLAHHARHVEDEEGSILTLSADRAA